MRWLLGEDVPPGSEFVPPPGCEEWGENKRRGINWVRVLDQAVGGAVIGAAGAATTACVAAALATAGPGCLAVVLPAAIAGAAGGAVVGAGTELWSQTAPPAAR